LNYSFVRFNSAQGLREFTENGGSGYFEYNLTKVLGVVADLSGYNNRTNNFKTFSYLFGPRFNMRRSRYVPYVQFLFGGTYAWVGSTTNGLTVSTTQNGFTTAGGRRVRYRGYPAHRGQANSSGVRHEPVAAIRHESQ
jgi:hypothetical protein